jgi:membrane associated rhomboid family serine protease
MYYFFYFPVGTDIACRRRPVVTWVLVGANVLAYILTRVLRPSPALVYELAFKPATPSLISALTACFLHADLFHLAGNVLYLALLGGPVEDRLGRGRFIVLYLLSGVVAMSAQAAVVLLRAPALAVYPVIGASGAAAGILGALLVRLPHARVRVASATLMFLHGVHKVGIRHVPAVLAVMAWIGIQLAYGLALPQGRTAYWSHIGGLMAGVALAVAAGAGRAGRFEGRLRRAERYMEQGNWFAAAGECESAMRLSPDDPVVHAMHGRALVAAGRRAAAILAFHRAVAEELKRGAESAAVRVYLEMERLLPGAVLEPAKQLRVAQALRKEGEFEAAARALIDFAAAHSRHPQAEMARLLAGELRADLAGDAEGAAALFRDVDPRRLSPRWQTHLRARRTGLGASRRAGGEPSLFPDVEGHSIDGSLAKDSP